MEQLRGEAPAPADRRFGAAQKPDHNFHVFDEWREQGFA